MKNRILGIALFLIMQLNTVVFAIPQILFEQQIETNNEASEICANDDFAFVQVLNTVRVYDISDADNIEYYADIDVKALNMVLDEKRLFIGHSSGCGFINLSDIKKGETLSLKVLSNSGMCTVGVKDKYVFVSSKTDGSSEVRDITLPRYRKVATLGSDYVGMKIKKNKAYVERDGLYHIYDMAEYAGESSIEEFKIGTVPVPDGVSNIDFKDNYVFMANQVYPSLMNKVYAYRINENGTSTNIWNHGLAGHYGTRISDLVTKENFLYVAGQDTRSIHLFNIENPELGADAIAGGGNRSGSYHGSRLALSGDKIIATDYIYGIAVYSVSEMMSGKADNLNLKLYPIRLSNEVTTIVGTSLKVKLEADNYLAREISGKVIVAAYSGEKLVNLITKDVTVAPCTMNQTFDAGNISTKTESGFKIKAMFWEDNTPIMKNITAEYVDEAIRNEFYVDGVNGNDEYDGTKEAPFATIEKARDAVRQVNRNMREDITVYIEDGIYGVEDTILFTAEDSGKNGNDIIYKAAEGANPVISGGTQITRWRMHDASKNIYKASAKGIYTRQLYVNGTRAIRARSAGGLSGASGDDGSVGITCSNTEIASYAHPEEMEFLFKGKWALQRIKPTKAEIVNGKCLITMQQPYWNEKVNTAAATTRISTPWYYENAYELLDSPGEFFIDKYSDIVYYIPRNGEDMATIKAYLPKMEEILRLSGDNLSSPIHNIKFEGLTFANTAWDYPLEVGNCESQNGKGLLGGKETPTAVYAMGAKNITFTGCRFKNMGGGGLRMEYGFSDIDIVGNEFYDISSWAMDIGEYKETRADDRMDNGNVEISNNYIHDVAVEYMGASAISIGFLSDTVIRNNELYNLPYTGIHVGWGWANNETSNTKNMVIRNNYIHEIMTTLNDGGAIYTNGVTGGTNDNPNLITQNYCTNQYAETSVIYTDEGSCYWLIEYNVIDTRAKSSVPYGSTWTTNIHDVKYINNYTTSTRILNNGGANCIYSGNYMDINAVWNQTAQNIIASAGLEAQYRYLKEN